MTELTLDDAVDRLRHLQGYLELHFRKLYEQRGAMDGNAPVFALEHDLSPDDLEDLKAAVRLVVALGFDQKNWRVNWLPFVVYAAELGFAYRSSNVDGA